MHGELAGLCLLRTDVDHPWHKHFFIERFSLSYLVSLFHDQKDKRLYGISSVPFAYKRCCSEPTACVLKMNQAICKVHEKQKLKFIRVNRRGQINSLIYFNGTVDFRNIRWPEYSRKTEMMNNFRSLLMEKKSSFMISSQMRTLQEKRCIAQTVDHKVQTIFNI